MIKKMFAVGLCGLCVAVSADYSVLCVPSTTRVVNFAEDLKSFYSVEIKENGQDPFRFLFDLGAAKEDKTPKLRILPGDTNLDCSIDDEDGIVYCSDGSRSHVKLNIQMQRFTAIGFGQYLKQDRNEPGEIKQSVSVTSTGFCESF